MHNSRMHVSRDKDRHVAGGSDQRHEDVVLALGSGHEDGGDDVAGSVHCFNDLTGLEGNEFHGGVVVEC